MGTARKSSKAQMTLPATPPTKVPVHGAIRQFFAACYDANVHEWTLVPCSRADLLKRVLVLS